MTGWWEIHNFVSCIVSGKGSNIIIPQHIIVWQWEQAYHWNLTTNWLIDHPSLYVRWTSSKLKMKLFQVQVEKTVYMLQNTPMTVLKQLHDFMTWSTFMNGNSIDRCNDFFPIEECICISYVYTIDKHAGLNEEEGNRWFKVCKL